MGLESKRQVRIANDIAVLVEAAVEAGEGRSMAEVVDRILRAEFIRREQAEAASEIEFVPEAVDALTGRPRASASVHRPRGRLDV